MGQQNNVAEQTAKLNSLESLLNEYKSYQNTNEGYDQSLVDEMTNAINYGRGKYITNGQGFNYKGDIHGISDDYQSRLQEAVNQAKQNSKSYADRMAAKSASDSAQSSAGSAQTAAQNTGMNRETAALVGSNKSDINYGNQYIQNRQNVQSNLNDARNEYLANQASSTSLSNQANNLNTGAFLNNTNAILQGLGTGAQVGMGF